jgi:preprotein translocase subunit SecG
MSLFIFLTVVQALVAAALVVTILMQRSEGGGLGIGGSPNGMMSARGAADFLSRSTKWLAVAFVTLSIALAAVAVGTTGSQEITSTVDRSIGGDASQVTPADPATAPAEGAPAAEPAAPAQDDPLADVTG